MRSRVAAICVLVLFEGSAFVTAQSLAGVAQREEERRKAIPAPARVITDKDLQPVPGPAPASTPAAPVSAALPADVPKNPDTGGGRVAVAAAQFQDGTLPESPTQAVSGGEVLLEVTVSKDGRVVDVKALRHTPPFTDALSTAVRTWQFRPAEDAAAPKPGEPVDLKTRRPAESKVLVAGLFRPPALYATTVGDAPRDVATPSDEIPFPLAPAKMPLYPPLGVADGIVVAELRVGPDGRLVGTRVVRSLPGFDQATVEAVQPMSFRPARVHGLATVTFAYVVAGFRRPVTSAPCRPADAGCFSPN